VTDERRKVDRDPRLTNIRQRLADVQRGSAAITRNNRGYAHPDEVFRARGLRDVVSMCMNVDESRRDDQAGDVNDLGGSRLREQADRRNPSVLDAYIAALPCSAGTINERAASDEDVEPGRLRPS